MCVSSLMQLVFIQQCSHNHAITNNCQLALRRQVFAMFGNCKPLREWQFQDRYDAVRAGLVTLLCLLYAKYPRTVFFNQRFMQLIITHRRIDVLRWAQTRVERPLLVVTADMAAEHGDVDVLRLLYQTLHICATRNGANAAANTNHLAVLKYMEKQYERRVLPSEIRVHHRTVIEWLQTKVRLIYIGKTIMIGPSYLYNN